RAVSSGSAGQRRMRRGNDYNRCGVIEERVISQRNADFDSAETLHALVDHDDVEAPRPRELEGVAAQADAGDFVSFALEDALHRTRHPFIAESNQSLQLRVHFLHEAASVRGLPGTAGSSVPTVLRSEEHTSELQSLAYLVCR